MPQTSELRTVPLANASTATELRELVRGWRRRPVVGGTVFVAPEGPGGGVLRIHERLPPCGFEESVLALVNEAGVPDGARATAGAVERFTTDEGENGTMTTVEISLGQARLERSMAVVSAGEWSLVVDLSTRDPARFDAFRSAARRIAEVVPLGLGEVRTRPFVHEPPPGWAVVQGGRGTTYLDLADPAGVAAIEVPWARPLQLAELQDATFFLDDAAEPTRDRADTSVPVRVAGCLRGTVHDLAGGHAMTARLLDDRFEYSAALRGSAPILAATRRAFVELVYSIQPIARPRAAAAQTSPMFAWAE